MNSNGNMTRVVEDSYLKFENGEPVIDPATGKQAVVHVRLVVTEADVLIATRRYRFQREAAVSYGLEPTADWTVPEGSDPDEFNLHVLTYPNLVAATLEASGIPWPLSFDQFLHLRQVLWDKWTEAVIACNPQWYGRTIRAEASDPNALTQSIGV